MIAKVATSITITLFFSGFVMLLAIACDNTPTHIFYGQEYNAAADCLETVTAVDTISGADTGQSCALVCVASPLDPEAGVTVYASTTCPPYPPLFDVSGNNPQCAPALAAAKRQSSCLDDGGASAPIIFDSGIADASTD
jgi:hypothetical protein